ncbi:MAG: ABC transporter substrate-binding protein [Bacteroidales bacterium]|nr:ABC transporter substrate-binding protein [Bacteroidales bacterium]
MKKYNITIALFLLILFVFSCKPKHVETSQNNESSKIISTSYPKYAKGFHIEYYDNYKILELINPWDTTRIMYRYLLIPKGMKNIPRVPESVIIETPINSIACLFTTQLAFIKKLGVTNKLTGMSRIEYVKDSTIRDRIEKGEIIQFGEPENPDSEKLIAIDPDILMVSPFRDNKYQHIESAGIPLAVNGSYMEATPLGRAEWIKFVAYFFEMENDANQIFNEIEKQYLEVKNKVEDVDSKPSIFTGRKFSQVWHVVGNNSYMANYLKDAGFDYIWKDLDFYGSVPYEFESVYEKAAHADYWSFIEYNEAEIRYSHIKKDFSSYADFDAFKNKQIIICNSKETPYFENGILEPHLVLSDFVKVAHPDILPDYKPKYFKLLK